MSYSNNYSTIIVEGGVQNDKKLLDLISVRPLSIALG